MGARDRSNQTETARRRNPEGRAQRRHICALGRMGSADRMPKERPRYPQVRSAHFLERESHITESHITDPTLLGPDGFALNARTKPSRALSRAYKAERDGIYGQPRRSPLCARAAAGHATAALRSPITSRLSHSITSSARARSVGGIVRPSALAVFTFTISSNFVGAWTGSAPASSPFKIRATYGAARLNRSMLSKPYAISPPSFA